MKFSVGLLKIIGKRMGDFQARAVLTLFYYVIFAPFALAVRWMADPLSLKVGTLRGWRSRREDNRSPAERAIKQS